MKHPTRHEMDEVERSLPREEWQRRQRAADEQAVVAARIESRVAAGESERAAIRAEAEGEAETTWVARLHRYRALGRDGLVDARVPPRQTTKLTPENLALIRGILVAAPSLRSAEVHARVVQSGVEMSHTLVKRAMHELGMAHPKGGAGHKGRERVQPLALAGAELLKAVDLELGATHQLTADLNRALEAVTPPAEGALDDLANRDELGRFLPDYNAPRGRTWPELGERFDSVELKRWGKDRSVMRTATSSVHTLQQKVSSLVLLPCVTDSPRWDALQHWQGGHLEELVGIGYQPATLDKFLRELKYAEVSQAATESVASFWMGQESTGSGRVDGAVIVYVDTSTKPVWTHHFSRCTKVSKLGDRVMPATSTVYLHAGCGTPMLFRSWSGHVSLPAKVGALLDSYESIAGPDTVLRLVVMDREAHAAWLFKDLRDRSWQFIIPLRKQVVGDETRFRDLSEWVAYGENGDQVRGGHLLLNDTRRPDEPIDVRVVGRRRHRTGKVAWYATLVDDKDFTDAEVLDIYFARWPLQEHVFRDGNGRVHLDAHYGYGKRKVDNVAVIDKLDKLDARSRRLTAAVDQHEAHAQALQAESDQVQPAVQQVGKRLDGLRKELDAAVDSGVTHTQRFRESYSTARVLDAWLESAATTSAAAMAATQKAAELRAKLDKVEGERTRLATQRQVFTMDTELDQIMTAFKITFMNLCAVLLHRYLGGTKLQLDTLIRAVLTLPGQRVLTTGTETIQIWRQPRDRQLMPAVEAACQALTARGLYRDERKLAFEVVDRPPP